jgi:hypothetical protein
MREREKKTFVFTRIGLVITFFLEVYFEISNIIIKKRIMNQNYIKNKSDLIKLKEARTKMNKFPTKKQHVFQ